MGLLSFSRLVIEWTTPANVQNGTCPEHTRENKYKNNMRGASLKSTASQRKHCKSPAVSAFYRFSLKTTLHYRMFCLTRLTRHIKHTVTKSKLWLQYGAWRRGLSRGTGRILRIKENTLPVNEVPPRSWSSAPPAAHGAIARRIACSEF